MTAMGLLVGMGNAVTVALFVLLVVRPLAQRPSPDE